MNVKPVYITVMMMSLNAGFAKEILMKMSMQDLYRDITSTVLITVTATNTR